MVIRARIDAARGPGMPRKFDVRAYLASGCGVDLTRINSIDTTTALESDSEVGPDLSRFKECQAPRPGWGCARERRFPGGKVLPAPASGTANRAAQERMAAAALRSSQSALGAYYRRLCARLRVGPRPSPPPPNKLARLIYT